MLSRERAAQQLVYPADELVEVDELGTDHFTAPGREQLVHEPGDPPAGPLDLLGIAADARPALIAGLLAGFPGGLVADERRVAEHDTDLIVEFVSHTGRQPADALHVLGPLEMGLQPGQPRALPGFGEGAADDRHQAGGPVFQDVVGGPLPDQLDGRLVADDPGQHDDGYVRALRTRDLEGGLAGKAGQREIGQDHVRAERGELLHVGRLGVHDAGGEVETLFRQETLLQFGIGRVVLQDENPERAPPRRIRRVPGRVVCLPGTGGRGAALPVTHGCGPSPPASGDPPSRVSAPGGSRRSGGGSLSSSQKTPMVPTTSANSAKLTGLRTYALAPPR